MLVRRKSSKLLDFDDDDVEEGDKNNNNNNNESKRQSSSPDISNSDDWIGLFAAIECEEGNLMEGEEVSMAESAENLKQTKI